MEPLVTDHRLDPSLAWIIPCAIVIVACGVGLAKIYL
jgi:hypothetical protein